MKKILSLVLALMMVLSLATSAFAGTFEDVTDADQAKAIDAIAALGIIDGYDDGTYKPEKVVTRAEMAKILIVALGYESIANDTPAFSDSQEHWAKGFIALASDLGVVNGRGNGIFDPDATVTYQEAAVMMLRALGYSDKAINNGKAETYNAGNYKTKALALGLFADLSAFSFSNGANRGDIALMLFANLTNDMVEINPNTGLAQPMEKGVQTLISKLATVTNVNVNADVVKKNTALNLADYLNYDLEVYKNAAGQIVYISNVLNTTYTGTFAANADSKKVNLVISTTDTKALALSDAAAVNIITNGVSSTIAEAALETNGAAKVIMTAGKNPTIKLAIFEKITSTVQAKEKYVTGRSSYLGITLPKTDNKVDESKITVVGDAATLADIEVDDIIQVVKASDNSVLKLYVTRNTVEGKITKVDAAGKVYVNGVAYTSTVAPKLALGNEGIFYLNKDGVIVVYSTTVPATVEKYAIVSSGIADGQLGVDQFTKEQSIVTYPRIKMIGLDAKETIYELAAALNTDGSVKTGSVVGVTLKADLTANTFDAKTGNVLNNPAHYLVKYSLDSKGRINKLEAVAVSPVKAKTNSINFLAGANTIVLNYADEEYSVNTLAELDAEVTYYAIGTSAFAWDLLITVDGITVETDNEYAVVLSVGETYAADGKTKVDEVTALVNGAKVTVLTVKQGTITTADKNKVLKLTMESGIIVAKEDAAIIGTVNTTVSAIQGNRISLAGETVSYKLAENAAVYLEGATSFSVSDIFNIITKESKVTLYKNAAGEVVIIVINK